MALSCIRFKSGVNLDETILDEMVAELKRKQHKNGTFDNLKTAALVVQVISLTFFDTILATKSVIIAAVH